MQRLREVDGDAERVAQHERVKLDEKEVSRDEVERAKENQGVRIVETEPNNYKTLQHLR
jgi:hypothetical protein